MATRDIVTHGSQTVGTSAVRVAPAGTSFGFAGIWIKAAAANTGIVYVGTSTVTANTAAATDGYPLAAGQETFVRIQDPTKIHAIASQAAQTIFWRAE